MPNFKKLNEDLDELKEKYNNEIEPPTPQKKKKLQEEFDEILEKQGITIKRDDGEDLDPEQIEKIVKFLEEVDKIENSGMPEEERKKAIEGMMGDYGISKLSIKVEGQPQRDFYPSPKNEEKNTRAANNDDVADQKGRETLPNSKNITEAVERTSKSMEGMSNSSPTPKGTQPNLETIAEKTANSKKQPQQGQEQENTNAPSKKA